MNSSRSNPYAAQRVQMPYGDAFIVNTPAIDRASNLIYTEQKQREAQQAKDSASLDDDFGKNLSKIRDADVSDLTKQYTDYKLAWTAAQKKRNLTPEDQLDLLRKKSAVFATINDSQNQKKIEDDTATGYRTNPDGYKDDTPITLKKSRALPISQLGEYKGYDYTQPVLTNLQPVFKGAMGELKNTTEKSEDVDNGFSTKTTHMQYGNLPAQYKDSLMQAMYDPKVKRTALAQLAAIPQSEIDSTAARFKAIPASQWADMGSPIPQDLTPKNPNDKLDVFTSYMAQKSALDNLPRVGSSNISQNHSAIIAEKNAHDFLLQRLKFGNEVALKNMEHNYQQQKEKSDFAWTAPYIDNAVEEAKKQGGNTLMTPAGPAVGYRIPLDKTMSDAFKVGNKYPETLSVSEDGKTFYPEYKKFVKTEGGKNIYEVDKNLSQPIPKEAVQLGLFNSSKGKVGIELKGSNRVATSSSSSKSSSSGNSGKSLAQIMKEAKGK